VTIVPAAECEKEQAGGNRIERPAMTHRDLSSDNALQGTARDNNAQCERSDGRARRDQRVFTAIAFL